MAREIAARACWMRWPGLVALRWRRAQNSSGFQNKGSDATTGWKNFDGTDHGRDARVVIDLLHEGADYLHYFRCRGRG